MKYAEIYNNTIITIHSNIPSSWNNISNFYAITQEQLYDLSSYGYSGYKFYPLIEEPYPSDTKFYNVNPPSYIIDDNNKVVLLHWSTTAKSPSEVWDIVRSERNRLLFKSDWTILSDSPLSIEKQNEYKVYRQALRDITTQNDPFNIIWPDQPQI